MTSSAKVLEEPTSREDGRPIHQELIPCPPWRSTPSVRWERAPVANCRAERAETVL